MKIIRFLTLVVLLLFASPVQAKLVLGVVPSASGTLGSEKGGRGIGAYLEKKLGDPVFVRLFLDEKELHQWLSRYREVDLAVLGKNYVLRQSAGEFFTLFEAVPGRGEDLDWIVARQGIQPALLSRIETVLGGMESDPEGVTLLRELGVARLAPLRKGDRPAAETEPIAAEAEPIVAETEPIAAEVEPIVAETEPIVAETEPIVAEAEPIVAEAEPIVAAGAPPVDATERLEKEAPVSLGADELTYDQQSDTYRASGRVQLQRGALTLSADNLDWGVTTGEAAARGNVHLLDPSAEMDGEELQYNMETGLGLLKKGRVSLREKNFHIAGDEIAKVGEQSYRVTRGTFTTCDGESPSWKFGAKKLDVTLGRYARAKHVVFYLKDIPVLYLPYIIYPVSMGRESGLLMPRFGVSEKRGTEFSTAYYLVIARNQDATFSLDYLSELGVGKGLEYRYIFGRQSEGVFSLYHINGLKEEENSHAFDWIHSGPLPGGARLSADVEYVSDKDHFEDFGEVAEEYNKDKAQSVLSVSKNWGKNNLVGQLKYTKDLEAENDRTLQRLPEIRFDALRRRLGDTPFYFEADSSYTYFWREEEAGDEVRGHRLSVRPALSAVFTPGNILEIVPEVGYRERLYRTSSEGPGYEREGIYDYSTTLSTRFSRVFHLGGERIEKIRHSIEPEIIYSYVPDDEQDHLPFFDDEDRIEAQNKFSYSLTNRFTAKFASAEGAPEYREFLYLRLSEEFDLRQERHNRKNLTGEEPFSAVRLELVARPTRQSFIDLDTSYDPVGRQLETFNAEAGIRTEDGNALSLDYLYRREGQEYLAANLDLALFEPVYADYLYRYDFADRTTLEQVLNLEYRSQCWSLYLTLRDRLEDQEYLVTFELSGIGRIAGFGGSLGNNEKHGDDEE